MNNVDVFKPLHDLIFHNVLFELILPYITHPFKNIHFSIPTKLFNILVQDILFLLALVALLYLLFLVIKFFRKWLIAFLKTQEEYACLEVKPLRHTELTAYSTEQLFKSLHELTKQRSYISKLIGKYKAYSLEIVSTKQEGIRYLLRVNEDDADIVKNTLLSLLPGISIEKTQDYLKDLNQRDQHSKVIEFKTTNPFAYPLKRQNELEEHDPIAYITGHMTKPLEDELISYQMVVSPFNKQDKEVTTLNNIIYHNLDLVSHLKSRSRKNQLIKLPFIVFKYLLLGIFHLFVGLTIGMFIFIMSGGDEGPFLNFSFGKSSKKTNNPYQLELEKIVKGKIDQPLFKVSLRVFLAVTTYDSLRTRERGFMSSLAEFNSEHQAIRKIRSYPLGLIRKFNLFKFKNRLLSLYSTSVLSVAEVSDLYHLPYTSTTKTEDLVKVHSKPLPAPLSLKKKRDLDVVFAKNSYGGTETLIGLTREERQKHMYVVGGTGTGKSTMLLSMIVQDMKNGKGIGVIDPHGELAEAILNAVPENRLKDVIYFNPLDSKNPIGLNLLELPENLDEDELANEKGFIADSIITLFHKLYPDKYSGPRMEYILRNTIHTSYTLPERTIFTIFKLLTNPKYLRGITKTLTDENLKDFWKYEFLKAGDYQKVKMISPITNKIGKFLFSPTAKRILEQERSTVDFDDVMDSGKILICNLSQGKLGEETSEMFGGLLMAKIELATLKRARVDSSKRKDFYLYIDEFQNFATRSFAKILSESRKYHLSVTLAHQTISQLEDKDLVNITLANVGTVVCFRTANPKDEEMLLPQFYPSVQKGEISNLPTFSFYIKISAKESQEAFSGETIPLQITQDQTKVEKIIELSRKQYGIADKVKSDSEEKQKTEQKKGKVKIIK